jgi:hypothetical protein
MTAFPNPPQEIADAVLPDLGPDISKAPVGMMWRLRIHL